MNPFRSSSNVVHEFNDIPSMSRVNQVELLFFSQREGRKGDRLQVNSYHTKNGRAVTHDDVTKSTDRRTIDFGLA